MVAASASAVAFTGETGRLAAGRFGALALAVPLGLLWWFVPRGMGFGDVRLAVLLGWTIGFSSGTRPALGAVLAVICLALASAMGLVLGLVVLGVRGRKAQVPFGPALVASALACIALAGPILEPFTS